MQRLRVVVVVGGGGGGGGVIGFGFRHIKFACIGVVISDLSQIHLATPI